MTRVQKAGLGLLVLVAVGLMGLVFTYTLRNDPPSDAEILERAQREKQLVLDQIAQGKLLYMNMKTVKKFDSSRISNPDAAWVGPVYQQVEVWRGVEGCGC